MEIRSGQQTVWIHCASLGEFEQGRPVMEAIKEKYPDVFLVLSFFSPSGYEVRKSYPGADAVVYLPIDTAANARDFLDILCPQLVIFIKYEYWVNYLEEMSRRDIPVLMVSAIYRENQLFFKWYGGRWREALRGITHFFVQDDGSRKLLNGLGIDHVTVSGDTRFDRVLAVQRGFRPVDRLEDFCRNRMIIVAGSTWDKDQELLARYVHQHPEIGLVLAPHEIGKAQLSDLKDLFPAADLYSTPGSTLTNVLIIDNVGMLSRLYHYAHICYIGGGFGAGIHNILEAAVYGKPVVFGPRYEKFMEARDLLSKGGAFTISGQQDLNKTLDRLLADEAFRNQCGMASSAYVLQQAGATGKLLGFIQENRLLTN
jgi:3-deoxy-D-manno-octulosonic-acid transferase